MDASCTIQDSIHVFSLVHKYVSSILGTYQYDEGFLFCSLVKGQEYNYGKGNGQKFRIYVPKGSKIVYLGNVNDEQTNYEVVVMRSAKLKIVSIDAVYINCKLI